MILRLLPASVLALLLSAPPALAETGIYVPAGPLATALSELSRQAGISIGGDLSLTGKQSPGVSAAQTPEQALARLLAGTGLVFRKVGPDAYRLEEVALPRVRPILERASYDPVEPIIVTATKRGANPADLPVSVGVLTGDNLTQLGAENIDAALPLLGGVSTTHLGPGRNKLAIRGLSDSAFTGQTQATVGLYLDNAKVNYNTPDPHLQLVDVERVEVLRGPQGTLYGGGSIGGILRIVPVVPDLSGRSGRVRLSGTITRDGAPGAGAELVLNQPLVTDRLAARLVYYADREGGVIDNEGGRHNIDSTDIQGGRLLFALVPADDWRVELGGTYQLIDDHDSHYVQGRRGCCTRKPQLSEPHDSDFDEAHVTISGHLSIGDLDSTTAFIRHELDTFNDASNAVPALAGLPEQPARFHDAQLSQLWTHETRLSGDVDLPPALAHATIDWLSGFYLSRQEAHSNRTLAPAADETALLWRRNRTDTVTEVALFGEASWRFHPDWTLTAGGRLFYVAQDVDAEAVLPIADRAKADGYARQFDYTPKVALTWQPWQGASFYAQIAEGYRPGGINVEEDGVIVDRDYRTTRFAADELWNFEVGTKMVLWQGRLSLDAAVFQSRWRNIQTDQLRPDGLTFTTNAGSGSNTGLEVGPSLLLGPWQLQASLTLSDSELTRINSGFIAARDGGLPGAAHVSGSASLSWQGSLTENIQAQAALDYTHTGRTNLTFTDGIRQGPIDLVGARVNLDLVGGWSVGLAADNILDTSANQFAFGNPFTLVKGPQANPARPRSFKLTIGWSVQ